MFISFIYIASSSFTAISFLDTIPCEGQVRVRCRSNASSSYSLRFYYEQPPSIPETFKPHFYHPSQFSVSEYNSVDEFIYRDLVILDVRSLSGSLFRCRHITYFSSKIQLTIPGIKAQFHVHACHPNLKIVILDLPLPLLPSIYLLFTMICVKIYNYMCVYICIYHRTVFM